MLAGFLLVNKPSGMTSRACVNHIARIIKKKYGCIKIGHTGTLDCFAQGLLIIGISRIATREIDQILTLDKQYIASAQLGYLTDTLDYTGNIIKQDATMLSCSMHDMQDAINSFGNAYVQVPPVYSALKHDGRRLSAYARSNNISLDELQAIALQKSRAVQLYDLSLLSFDVPVFTCRAHVSHGTYIRTLVDDIAKKVGTHATTQSLIRIAIGPFFLADAKPLFYFDSIETIIPAIISVDKMLELLAQYKKGEIDE